MQVGRKRFINYADIDLLPNYHSLSRNFRLPNYCLTRTVEHERVRLGRKPRCERCLQWKNLMEESHWRAVLVHYSHARMPIATISIPISASLFYPKFRFAWVALLSDVKIIFDCFMPIRLCRMVDSQLLHTIALFLW